MVEVTINDVVVEAEAGDGLLDVARRHKAHIGFVCNGNGLCTTCELRVISGRKNVSLPNKIEYDWLPKSRVARGYRLACQTTLTGTGPVTVMTRAEELRRLWDNLVLKSTPATYDNDLRQFARYVTVLNIEYLSKFPVNLARTVARLGVIRTILPVDNNREFLQDVGGIIDERTKDETTI